MINIFPTGYISNLLHDIDKENNPRKHYFCEEKYSRQEASEMCFLCAEYYNANKKYQYDSCTDSFYKIKAPE